MAKSSGYILIKLFTIFGPVAAILFILKKIVADGPVPQG